MSEPAFTSRPSDSQISRKAELAKVIPRRARVNWWIGLVLALAFAVFVMPLVTADQWLASAGAGKLEPDKPAPLTVRVPPFAGFDTAEGHIGGGGVLVGRGEVPSATQLGQAQAMADAMPHAPYLAFFVLIGVLAGLFAHHVRRSVRGRLLRVQLTSLAWIAVSAAAVKVVMLATSISVLAVPVAVFAMVPILVLDRMVGLATGTLAALVFSMLVPFDVGVAVLMLVSAGAAGLVIAERPKQRWRAAITAGGVATVFTGVTYLLLQYLTTGRFPVDELRDPLHSAWAAAVIGPALATVLAVPLIPVYQLLVGEITQAKLIQLEDLSHPLLRQIAENAPGTWQHSLSMANMAESAASAIGANGHLVRVGAYFHDLGKSLQPKYFIENLEPGEPSPHDRLPPEVSCDAIFAHVTEGIVTARRTGLHERIIDFMHMHHGNGVLEYFWAKCREQGNPRELTIEDFRYPGVPPQSRETAILAICDAVEAASRTLKKPDAQAVDNLVQRIVYGKLHLGQLDDSGLSMSDLRRVTESLRDTIRHANHGRIEYPWQREQQPDVMQDMSAFGDSPGSSTPPRLDSLDRPARPESVRPPTAREVEATTPTGALTPKLRVGIPSASASGTDLAIVATAPVPKLDDAGAASTALPIQVQDTASGAVIKPRPPTQSDSHQLAPRRDSEQQVPREIPHYQTRTGGHQAQRASSSHDQLASSSGSQYEIARASGSHEVVELTDRSQAAFDAPTAAIDIARTRAPTAVEVRKFASDAQAALEDTAKGASALPRDAAQTRAATLPPAPPRRTPTMPPFTPPVIKPPTNPPPVAVEPPPLQPPSSSMPLLAQSTPSPKPDLDPRPFTVRPRNASGADGPTNPPPMRRAAVDDDPALSARRTQPRLFGDDASTTQPRMVRASDDASTTQPRMARASDDPNNIADVMPESLPPGESSWARGLAARIDAAIDDDFGGETPARPPTKAELQALTGFAPDPTKRQSLEELERLHRRALEGRHTPQTTEVTEDDIEAAIDLAPPARKTSIGVAKKKPSE